MRRRDALHTRVVTDERGYPTGLDCLVMPLWRARRTGGRGHPLSLTRQELAVLLRLCEVLFGPGWAPKDKEPTPPGLLASRTGKGAATDRLGLLLLVLSASPKGWLRLCPGTVDRERGRPAATVARLLGRSPSGGAKVLARLEEQGVAEVVRRERENAQGMKRKSRVRLLPVVDAHREQQQAVREARTGASPVFSHLPASAAGDLAPGETQKAEVTGAAEVEEPEIPDLPDTAELHADHAPVAEDSVCGAGSGGFSGSAVLECGGRRGGARTREDSPTVTEQPTSDGAAAAAAPGPGPLRGEKPNPLHLVNSAGQEGSSGVPGASGNDGGLAGRVPAPPDDLQVVLGPVQELWARLTRPGARAHLVRKIRGHLQVAAGVAGPDAAESVVAARLERRLCAQGGPHRVEDPVGWLLARGLPQRAECFERRCDEGVRLDTGGPCETCEVLAGDRRADREAA
ncbi:hypothetical protein AN218_18520, partial [Streptomyces nanshensis]